MTNIAIEHGHRNSWFFPLKEVIFHRFLLVYQRVAGTVSSNVAGKFPSWMEVHSLENQWKIIKLNGGLKTLPRLISGWSLISGENIIFFCGSIPHLTPYLVGPSYGCDPLTSTNWDAHTSSKYVCFGSYDFKPLKNPKDTNHTQYIPIHMFIGLVV